MDSVLQEANQKIDQALMHLKKELASIRAGRANPALVEEIPVEVYGSKMKLVEVGTISAPQPTLLTIQVWDASIINDVQRSIFAANLGLNPAVDGQTIRLPIPPLTEERREEFVGACHQKGEECKISVRKIRAEVRALWDKDKESGSFGEDELERREKILQDLIDKSVGEIDELVKGKEAELRKI